MTHRAAADQDGRCLGLRGKTRCRLEIRRRRMLWLNFGHREAGSVCRQFHHVRRDFDMHRSRTAAGHDREGAGQNFIEIRRIGQRVRPQCHRGSQSRLIRQLMQMPAALAQRRRGIDAGDHQHRDAVSPRLSHRGQRVGQPRSGDDETDAGPPGDTRIAIGHEARTLFVARRDVADRA